MRQLIRRARLFASPLLTAIGVWASVAHAGPRVTAVMLKLPASPTAHGLEGEVTASGIRVWACPDEGVCSEGERANAPPTGRPVLTVPLPAELPAALSGVISTPHHFEGGDVLEVRVATPQGPFLAVILPPTRLPSGELGEPRLALKGRLDPDESFALGEDGHLLLREPAQACELPSGHGYSENALRLDLAEGRFVRARVAPLTRSERDAAVALPMADVTENGLPVFAEPLAGSTGEGVTWAHGYGLSGSDRVARPHGSLAFLAHSAALLRVRWEAGRNPAPLYLALGSDVYRLPEPTPDGEIQVRLPARASEASSSAESCALLVSGEGGAAPVSVALVDETHPDWNLHKIISELGGQNGRSATLALLATAPESARAIGEEFRTSDKQVRAKILSFIPSLPPEFRAEALLWVATLGDEFEKERAERMLAEIDHAVLASAYGSALRNSAGRNEGELALRFAEFDAVAALTELTRYESSDLPKQGRASVVRARRRALRDGLARAAMSSKAAGLVDALLVDKKLSPTVRRELLRALGDQVVRHASAAVGALPALTRDFRGQYVLGEVELRLFDALPAERRAALTAAAAGKGAPGWSSLEAAAYQSKLLSGLSAPELAPGTRVAFESAVRAALDAEAPLIRQEALSAWAAGARQKEVGRDFAKRLEAMLEGDPWPEVREGAARAAGVLGSYWSGVERKAWVEGLASRANRDEEPSVQRALVRAIAESGAPERSQLLSKLLKDGKPAARVEAVEQLGRICERSMMKELTQYALALGEKTADPVVVDLGIAAVRAIAQIGPADMEARLSPLQNPAVPGPIRGEVRLLLETTRARCGK